MSPVLAAALSQSRNCHPEAEESLASGSQRRISVFRADAERGKDPGRARLQPCRQARHSIQAPQGTNGLVMFIPSDEQTAPAFAKSAKGWATRSL